MPAVNPLKETGRGDVDQLRGERVGVGGDFPGGWRGGQLLRWRVAHCQHLFDGPDSGDRLLGEIEGQSHRANQAPVHVNRAAAHALHDAGLRERPAGEPRQNDGLPGPDVFEHAQDLHLEFLDFVALENRLADGMLARAHVAQRKDRDLPGGKLRPNGHRENQ